jgi:hypothetical protein
MTISLPAGIHLQTVRFRPIEPVRRALLEGGATQAVSTPNSHWIGTWRTLRLKTSDIGLMQAWLDSLANGAVRFYGTNTQHCGLYAHASLAALTLDASPWDGVTTLTAINSLVSVDVDAPAGLSLKPGDRFEVRNATWHHLAQVDAVLTNGSEGDFTITFRPPLPVGAFSIGDTADFSKQRIPMVLTDYPDPDIAAVGTTFTFSGRSV